MNKFNEKCKEILNEGRDSLIGKTVTVLATPEELGPDFPFDYGKRLIVVEFVKFDKGGIAVYKLTDAVGENEVMLPSDLFDYRSTGTPMVSGISNAADHREEDDETGSSNY
jgi:hypothetical protein